MTIPSDFQLEQRMPSNCDYYVKFEAADFKKGHNDKGLKVSVTPSFVKNENGIEILVGATLRFDGQVNPTDAKSQALQVSPGPFLKNFLYAQNGIDSKKVEIIAIDSKGEEQLKLLLEADGKLKIISPKVEFQANGNSLFTEVELRAPKTTIYGHKGTTHIPFDVTKLNLAK